MFYHTPYVHKTGPRLCKSMHDGWMEHLHDCTQWLDERVQGISQCTLWHFRISDHECIVIINTLPISPLLHRPLMCNGLLLFSILFHSQTQAWFLALSWSSYIVVLTRDLPKKHFLSVLLISLSHSDASINYVVIWYNIKICFKKSLVWPLCESRMILVKICATCCTGFPQYTCI